MSFCLKSESCFGRRSREKSNAMQMTSKIGTLCKELLSVFLCRLATSFFFCADLLHVLNVAT